MNDWYVTSLKVGGYPTLKELDDMKPIDLIINVSDEFYGEWFRKISKHTNTKHVFLPLGESPGSMKVCMSTFFAALNYLFDAEANNERVYLHCMAGQNRSVTVAHAYYYMMFGKHFESINTRHSNQLIHNCRNERMLPSLDLMEKFIQRVLVTIKEPHRFMGGQLDWCLEVFQPSVTVNALKS